MDKPSILDNIREWIGSVSFSVYLWSIKMSVADFWNEQDRQAMQHIRASGEDYSDPNKEIYMKCHDCQMWGSPSRLFLDKCGNCHSKNVSIYRLM